MALRRAAMMLGPKLVQQQPAFSEMASLQLCRAAAPSTSDFVSSFATSAVEAVKKDSLSPLAKLSMSPSANVTYDEHNHVRFPAGTEGRPFAYFVLAGGRFLYASAIRLAVIKAVLTMSAAADTLAMSSLEVDLGAIEEGSTITVKWRGKPVFISHRTDSQIETAASTPLSDLKDPQTDGDRVVDPKYLIVVGVCTHLGCVPIAGAGNYNGWFCPCHGSHYDGSGRIREGPAPYNLEVPEYQFLDGGKVRIG